jgi:hypothetical protein
MINNGRIEPYPMQQRQEQLANLAAIVVERAGTERLYNGEFFELKTAWLPTSHGREIKVTYDDFDENTARLDISTTTDGVAGVRTNTVAIRNRAHQVVANHYIPDGIEDLTALLASALELYITAPASL